MKKLGTLVSSSVLIPISFVIKFVFSANLVSIAFQAKKKLIDKSIISLRSNFMQRTGRNFSSFFIKGQKLSRVMTVLLLKNKNKRTSYRGDDLACGRRRTPANLANLCSRFSAETSSVQPVQPSESDTGS